ncbi:unnamed protein product, partial [Rotaria sp. Silwood2]
FGWLFHFGQCLWREVQSLGLQNKYTNDDKFRINVKKLMGLAFVPVGDVLKAYSSLINDFDDEDYLLLDYFERVWVGQKKSSRRDKPRFSLQLWNIYDRVIQDLSRSNNAIEGWHHAFNTSVSIKHPSITKLAKCILRVQARFEIDIERLRAGELPKKNKKEFMLMLTQD